ncbi:hypothetical protein [Rossellomorea marisflavi]|uniref:hypothetical protein n=1 Tax=Rossellomorea marisflavi TaxID=189381 RepID=UPI001BC8A559|nr:hypothetical protein [Rossellomorea marisflavi]
MMQRSYFFNTPDGGAPVTYSAEDFARFHAQIIGNGVSNTPDLDDLQVIEKTNMTVSLLAGYAFANGYMYENTSALDLTADVANTTYDRIDRVVIRFDNTPTERRVYAYIKKGTPAANPVPPAMYRGDSVFELSVAQILVVAGKSYVEQSQITDERPDDRVCGYIPLHNIYRGLEIDRNGTASFLNQSFFKSLNGTKDTTGWTTEGQSKPLKFGTVVEDTQHEQINSYQIKVKTSGVYYVYCQVGFYADQSAWPVGLDLQTYLHVNGQQRHALNVKVLNSTNDNYSTGSTIERVEAGDTIHVEAKMFNLQGKKVQPNHVRIHFAKIM